MNHDLAGWLKQAETATPEQAAVLLTQAVAAIRQAHTLADEWHKQAVDLDDYGHALKREDLFAESRRLFQCAIELRNRVNPVPVPEPRPRVYPVPEGWEKEGGREA